MIKNNKVPKVAEVKTEAKEVVEPVKVDEKVEEKIEEKKVEEKKIEEPAKVFVKEIVDDDLNVSNISVGKKESAAEPIVEVKEEIKVAPVEVKVAPTINKLDEKEADYKLKQTVMEGLIDIAGPENDYLEFVRKNYKQGVDACLNLWYN